MTCNYLYSFFVMPFLLSSLHGAQVCQRSLSIAEDIVVGSAAGAVEVTMCTPLFYVKNMIQQRAGISRNPLVWYRGFGFSLLGSAPITAVQVSLNGILMPKNREVSSTEKITIATAAGACSGFISGPTEAATLYSQTTGASVRDALRRAPLAKGMVCTMMRDGIFTAAYLAGMPTLERSIHAWTDNAIVAKVGAGVFAGVATTLITHPFDTGATIVRQHAMQIPELSSSSSWHALSQAYKETRMRGFYRGFGARGVRLSVSIPLLNSVATLASDALRSRS